jgi:hypothetical protein
MAGSTGRARESQRAAKWALRDPASAAFVMAGLARVPAARTASTVCTDYYNDNGSGLWSDRANWGTLDNQGVHWGPDYRVPGSGDNVCSFQGNATFNGTETIAGISWGNEVLDLGADSSLTVTSTSTLSEGGGDRLLDAGGEVHCAGGDRGTGRSACRRTTACQSRFL